ncbi:MAG TPA: dTDP-4-amino-4,6-dideoxygalactose transaminase, partial [Acidimicrobiia bacterium]|nr:dTDP-4-amino-4,6-dideoxygalactose transaminase [Acidimicrobiia bacterium]
TPPPPIAFNLPTLVGNELDYVRLAVEGVHTSDAGPFSRRAADLLREEHGAADVLLTTSCTDALEMAAMLLEHRPGDTVIVPSFTFVSTALAFAREGFRLVFADIEPTTLAIDPRHVANLVDDHTRAVVAVHYGGIAADLPGLARAFGGRPVDLLEDNAHGLFATVGGRTLGTFGRLATLSFHETKNFTCGEGGALVLNHPGDVDRAHVLLHKGTNRRAFLLGQVDKYSWQDLGSSFGLCELNAAYLLAQLEARREILARRREVFDGYARLLEPRAPGLGLGLPRVPPGDVPGYHLYYVLLPDRPTRDRVMAAMRAAGVMATFHYVPLHSSPGGRRFAARETDCPVTDDISGRLIRLPFHNALTPGDVERVVNTLLRALV